MRVTCIARRSAILLYYFAGVPKNVGGPLNCILMYPDVS